MIYTPDSPVPPLTVRAKIRVTQAIRDIVWDTQESEVFNSIKAHNWETPEEKEYAIFWWLREQQNPNWRDKDEQRKTPIRAQLRAVQ